MFGGPSWTWDARRRQYYLHNFLSGPAGPRTSTAPRCRTPWWPPRGSGWIAASTASASTRDQFRDARPGPDRQPADPERRGQAQPAVRLPAPLPQPVAADIPTFLTRLRQPGRVIRRPLHGGRGRGRAGRQRDEAVHGGPDRLHSAYGFLYLYADTLAPALIRQGAAMWPGGEGQGWPSWTFSNHDAPRADVALGPGARSQGLRRHVAAAAGQPARQRLPLPGRGAGSAAGRGALRPAARPRAIANWPETLGRDGARTPMPWVAVAAARTLFQGRALAADRSVAHRPGRRPPGARRRLHPQPDPPRRRSAPPPAEPADEAA